MKAARSSGRPRSIAATPSCVADTRQLERGHHTLVVDYSGDDTYEPASDEVSIRVKRSN